MVTRTLTFLRQLYGTEPFRGYCQSQGIAFEQETGRVMTKADERRWTAALRVLPETALARVELELAQVQELGCLDGTTMLLEAAKGSELPPESVPGDVAVALWFFLHHPDIFQEVYLRFEVREVAGWRVAWAPAGIVPSDLSQRQEDFARSLREFFRMHDGSGKFCAVESHALPDAFLFIAHLSHRLQLLDVFTDTGEHTTKPTRPAFPLLFVYYPRDGRVLLRGRQRSRERVLDLFQRFGEAVLGVKLDDTCLAPTFQLDLLKRRFDPPRDAEDMEGVRVRALSLLRPEREERRMVTLKTPAGDEQFAILELLHEHGGKDGRLEEMEVVFAELEVKLREHGRGRRYPVRLWRDRSNLNHTPTGQRLSRCLVSWGLAHAPES